MGATLTFKLTQKQCEVRDLFALGYTYLLVYGGSRSGKTFFICYSIMIRALKAPGSRHVIFRNDGVDAKQSIAKDTMPKVIGLAFPGVVAKWYEQDGYFALPNGSEIWIAGLKDKERLDKVLGREFATIYINEASQVALMAFEMVKTRLAQQVTQVDGRQLPLRLYVDLNPTVSQHWTYQVFVNGINPDGGLPIPDHAQDYAFIAVNPRDNEENLPPEYLKALQNMSERMRKRFWDGLYTADDDNALWRRSYIVHDTPPEMKRIVIAIDPAISSQPGSDETGLIAIGLGVDGRGWVLADESGKYRPEEWARRAWSMFDTFDADCFVAEINQGGEMVETTLRSVSKGRTARYKGVHATRGKVTRAEPIAALYEQNKMRHAKPMVELEDQMCTFTVGFDRKEQGYSPDRLDALVWGATELFPAVVQTHRPTPAHVDTSRSAMGGARAW